MNEASREPDLAIESLGAGGDATFGAEHFEGDVAIALEVASEVHDRHPSLAELAFDAIPIGEAGVEGIAKTGRALFAHGKRLAPSRTDRKRPVNRDRHEPSDQPDVPTREGCEKGAGARR